MKYGSVNVEKSVRDHIQDINRLVLEQSRLAQVVVQIISSSKYIEQQVWVRSRRLSRGYLVFPLVSPLVVKVILSISE